MHRDVSVGNILIDDDPQGVEPDATGYKQPRGFLNDWDLCKYQEELDTSSKQKQQVVSWFSLISVGCVLT